MSRARRNHRKRVAASRRPEEVGTHVGEQCCCSYGIAVSGEWPEFECFRCKRHGGEFAAPDEMCRRHRNAKVPVRIRVVIDRPGAKARFVVVENVR